MNVETFQVDSGTARLSAVRFGEGPPLLLAHPAVFSKAYFASAAEVWGASYSCVAFDQRGHGDTEVEGSGCALAFDELVADIRAVMDHVGWDRAALGGTSLGAATTLGFSLRYPGRVSALVQDLPAFGPGSNRNEEKSERMAQAFERGNLEEAAGIASEGLSEPRAKAWTGALFADWNHYRAAILGAKLSVVIRDSSSWRVAERWPDDLAALNMPVRILAVPGDPVHPLEVAETMAGAIPDAKLIPRVSTLDPSKIAAQWIDVLAGASVDGKASS